MSRFEQRRQKFLQDEEAVKGYSEYDLKKAFTQWITQQEN